MINTLEASKETEGVTRLVVGKEWLPGCPDGSLLRGQSQRSHRGPVPSLVGLEHWFRMPRAPESQFMLCNDQTEKYWCLTLLPINSFTMRNLPKICSCALVCAFQAFSK